jgi:hypothetical protein
MRVVVWSRHRLRYIAYEDFAEARRNRTSTTIIAFLMVFVIQNTQKPFDVSMPIRVLRAAFTRISSSSFASMAAPSMLITSCQVSEKLNSEPLSAHAVMISQRYNKRERASRRLVNCHCNVGESALHGRLTQWVELCSVVSVVGIRMDSDRVAAKEFEADLVGVEMRPDTRCALHDAFEKYGLLACTELGSEIAVDEIGRLRKTYINMALESFDESMRGRLVSVLEQVSAIAYSLRRTPLCCAQFFQTLRRQEARNLPLNHRIVEL